MARIKRTRLGMEKSIGLRREHCFDRLSRQSVDVGSQGEMQFRMIPKSIGEGAEYPRASRTTRCTSISTSEKLLRAWWIMAYIEIIDDTQRFGGRRSMLGTTFAGLEARYFDERLQAKSGNRAAPVRRIQSRQHARPSGVHGI